METKNRRKVPFAIVWHKKTLGIITTQNVGKDFLLINNLDKVKKNEVKLLKVGDVVKIDSNLISQLPERWQTKNHMLVTKILSNGIIETDHSKIDNDGINYTFLVRHY